MTPVFVTLAAVMRDEPSDFIRVDHVIDDRGGHAAVTVVRTGTSQVTHMLDNIGGGVGRLPNETTRKRMVELVGSWPRVGGGGR